MIIGYARVFTAGQDLAGQIEELKNKGAEKIYSEKFTGTRVDRPVFERVLKKLKKGDTLMVTKLDRFARNTVEAIQVVQKLFNSQIAVHILNIGIIEDNPTGRLTFNIFSAFAEFERDMIVTRTQEGKI
ncbi:recombinase family protein [Lactobacillus mellis]|nr:recombinase family protein [Bombilactobacillus mellis]